MYIYFKFLNGKQIGLVLDNPITAKDVLSLIRSKEDIPNNDSVKLCVAGRALHDNDIFFPNEAYILLQNGEKIDLREYWNIVVLGTFGRWLKDNQTKNVGTSSNFTPSRYQQLQIEQKQHLSEITQSVRHSIDIGKGKHPSTEDYFTNWLSTEEQMKLLNSMPNQDVVNSTKQFRTF